MFQYQPQTLRDYLHGVRVEVCDWCEYQGHTLAGCPGFLAAKRAQQSSQVEVNTDHGWNTYSQTYNPGWSSHPDLSWSDSYWPGDNQPHYPASPSPPQSYPQYPYQWPQSDPIDPYYQPSMSEGPDSFGYGPPLDSIDETASTRQLE